MRAVVLTPEEIIWEGMAKEVLLPGDDGEVNILDFHQPFFYTLRSGTIYIDKGKARFFIKEGLARMISNELLIFTEKVQVKT